MWLEVAREPDALGADAGRCDPGPLPLGANVSACPDERQYHDAVRLEPMHPKQRYTPASVAGHAMYEPENPNSRDRNTIDRYIVAIILDTGTGHRGRSAA